LSEDVSAGRLLLEVVADTTGLKAGLKAKIDAIAAQVKAEVKAQADTTAAKADLDKAAAEVRFATIKAKADIAAAKADLDKAAKADRLATIKARADTATAKADLDKAAAGDRLATIKAKADTAQARADITAATRDRTVNVKTSADKSSLNKTITDIGEKMTAVSIPVFIGSGLTVAVGAAGQLAGALVAVAAAGAQAVGVVGALPGLLLAAAQAGGAVKLGFSGITAAVSAYSARQATAGTDAVQSAQQVRAAQDAVRTSAQALGNAQIDGAQQAAQAQHAYQQSVVAVADAQYNASQSAGSALHAEQQAVIALADARYSAAQTATTDEHSYTDALFSEQQAQVALSQARLDARQNLIQTAFSLRDAVLGEKQAALSLAEAKIKLTQTNQSAAATPQMRAQALLDYQQAQLQQQESVNKAQQAAAAKTKADRQGVSGSQGVVQARHSESDAAFALQQAEQAVARARVEAARSVKEAQYQLTQAVQADSRAQVMAVRSVTAAQYAEAQAAQTIASDRRTSSQQLQNAQVSYSEALLAAKSPLLGVSSAQTALNVAMGKLTPAGRALVQFIDSTLIPKYHDLQKATATALLPGVTSGLKSALPVISTIKGGLTGTGRVLGGVASRFGSYLGNAGVNSDLSGILSTNTKAIGRFGDAALHIVDAIRNVAVAAEPLVTKVSEFADKIAKAADSLSKSGRASGALAKFFDDAWKSATQLGKIAGNLLLSLGRLLGAAAPSGSSLLGSLVLATGKLAEWTGSSGGQAKMSAFFAKTIPVARQFGDLLLHAATVIGEIVGSFGGGQLSGLFTVLNLALTILSTLTRLPGFGQVVQWVLLLSGAGAGLGFVAQKVGAIGKGLGVLSKFTGLDALAKKLGLGDTAGGAIGGGAKKLGGKILGTKAVAATVGEDGEAVAGSAATGLQGVFAAAGTAAGTMAGKIGTALASAKGALSTGVSASAGWASGFASSMGTAIASGASFVANLGRQLAAGARSLVVFIGEQAVAAGSFIAGNVAMAASATAAFIAENAATLGIIGGLTLLIGAIVYTATHWSQVWGLIKGYAKDAWDFISNGIGKYLLVLLGPAGLIILGIIEVSKHWSSIWGTIRSVVADAWKFISKGTSDLVTGLSLTWAKIRQIFEDPVKFVVNTVYDNGIAKVWNWVASKLGMPTLPTLKLAAGGRVPGTGSGDHVPALLEPRERVLSRKQVASFGGGSLEAGHAALDSMVGRGGSAGPGYQDGGILPWLTGIPGDIGHAVASGISGVWDGAKLLAGLVTNPVGTATKLFDSTLGGLSKLGGTPVGKMIEAIPRKFVSSAVTAIKSFLGLGGGAGQKNVTPGVITGTVAEWFAKAVQLTGVPANWIPDLETIGRYESSDNPRAINNSDSNAAAGDPSRGIMQTIATTFQAFHQSGTSSNIYDPVANIAAAINYIKNRYSSVFNVPGIRSLAAGQGYQGYDSGGPLHPGRSSVLNSTGRDEWVLTPQAVDLLGGPPAIAKLNMTAGLYRTGSAVVASAAAEARTPAMAGATVNVYPTPGMSEEHIGQVAARKLGMMLG
jgi:SLT domain-containing protein